jgi:curved DNA-binding protein CbpA
MKTLYDVLGVDRQATLADIEQSYRHSLNQHFAGTGKHSLRKQDRLRLQKMREAYLLLASPSRRHAYDLHLERREGARLRTFERLGMVFGVLLLVLGLALIGRGYYRIQEREKAAAVIAPEAVKAGGETRTAALANKEP